MEIQIGHKKDHARAQKDHARALAHLRHHRVVAAEPSALRLPRRNKIRQDLTEADQLIYQPTYKCAENYYTCANDYITNVHNVVSVVKRSVGK